MASKTFFSKSDLYHFADRIVEMKRKHDLITKFAQMEGDDQMAGIHSTISFELGILIKAYGLKEMVKIE